MVRLGLFRFLQLFGSKKQIKSLLEIIILFLFVTYLCYLVLNISLLFCKPYSMELILKVTGNIPPSDPVRWWPSGVPQAGMSILSALGTYVTLNKLGLLNPRARVISALAAGGLSTGQMIYNGALENPVGFNRLM